jgi:hypothetical protein
MAKLFCSYKSDTGFEANIYYELIVAMSIHLHDIVN